MPYHNTFVGTLCRCHHSVFPTVVMRALFFASLGAFAMYLREEYPKTYEKWVTPNTDMHTYMSMMVAMMIAFRTNNCYGRYDKGVGLTGTLKTVSRILVTQAAGYAQGKDEKALLFVEETRRQTMLLVLFFKRHMHEQVRPQLPLRGQRRAQQQQQQLLLVRSDMRPRSPAVCLCCVSAVRCTARANALGWHSLIGATPTLLVAQ